MRELEFYMDKALSLAGKGLGTTSPNPMVGAVIVKDGIILGEGWHVRAGEGHAEVNAFSDAAKKGNDVKAAALFVTLEPCSTKGRTPACTDAILASGVKKVVIGCLDPNPKHAGRAVKILEDAGIEVISGVLEKECLCLNEAFFHWITTGKPFVLLKTAQTLDGKIACYNGVSQWITGKEARNRVMDLRMWADCVVTGGQTFRMDHPRFTVRDEAGNILKTPRRIVVTNDVENMKKSCPEGEKWEFVSLKNAEEWEKFLLGLGSENVTSILLECGGTLAASALEAKAVNKVEFHIAPKILGGEKSIPSIAGSSPENLEKAWLLEDVKYKQYGKDLAFSGLVKYK